MTDRLKKRQRAILIGLAELGGEATTREIADQVALNTNGVAQSLGALTEFVEEVGDEKGGNRRWKIHKYQTPTNKMRVQ